MQHPLFDELAASLPVDAEELSPEQLALREAEAAQRELDADLELRGEREAATAKLREYAATTPREVALETKAQARDTAEFVASLPAAVYDVPLVRRDPSRPWRVERGERLTTDQRRAYHRYCMSTCIRPRLAARSSRAGRPRARTRRERRGCRSCSAQRGKPRRSQGGDEPPGERPHAPALGVPKPAPALALGWLEHGS